jgi:hypothetical protein
MLESHAGLMLALGGAYDLVQHPSEQSAGIDKADKQ